MPVAPSLGSAGDSGEVFADTQLAPAEVYHQHFDQVSKWVAHQLGPCEDREDLVQEVFMIALKRLENFRGEAKLTTWLYGITRNVVRNYRRKARWRRWLSLTDSEGAIIEPIDDSCSPHDSLEQSRREKLVYEILDQLREIDRTLLVLFEIEELSGQEIAARLDLSLSNVWVRLHRARKRFLKRLEQHEKRGSLR